MEKNKLIEKDKDFLRLMEDANIIAQELEDLQYYLELDVKTPTINEYQVFITLYLKRKVNSCLEKVDVLMEENKIDNSMVMAEVSKSQFEKFKQLINTLDAINRSREISMIYTKEEAEYISAWEEKREKRNPASKLYPIRTQLTFKLRKRLRELTRNQLIELVYIMGISSFLEVIMGFIGVFAYLTNKLLLGILSSVIAIIVIVNAKLTRNRLLGKSKESLMSRASIRRDREKDKINIGIKDLRTACREYGSLIKTYKKHLRSKEQVEALESYISKSRKKFITYDDYEVYVDMLLLCEELNPLLVERGIIYSIQQQKTIKKNGKKRKLFNIRGRVRNPQAKPLNEKTIKVKKEFIQNEKKVFKLNITYHRVKGQGYSSTKPIVRNYSKGRRGR